MIDQPGGGHDLLHRPRRVVALLQARDLAGVDAEIDAYAADVERLGRSDLWWYVPLWRAMRALLQGRFTECERQHAAAASGVGSEALCAVQLFSLRLAQDRLVELEALAHSLADPAFALCDRGVSLACLRGMLGRDSEARTELLRLAADGFAAIADDDRWLATMAVLGELAATLDRAPEAAVLYDALVPQARSFAVEADGAVCHGSLSRHLGLLAHTLGRWDDADAHFRQAFEDNSAAGAPLLVAHVARQWSALLRARDLGDDWERGLDLLVQAEAIYRRLGIDRLADESRQVLARSHEPAASERQSAGNAFRREGDSWMLAYGGLTVHLPDSLGLHDLAALLGNPGRSFHVTDLAAGVFAGGIGHAGQIGRPTGAAGAGGVDVDFDTRARAENETRLAELDRELAAVEGDGDPVEVSLALAERDVVAAELAATTASPPAADPPPPGDPVSLPDPSVPDPVERARRAVTARIRLSLDAIDAAHPALGRHLRHSVRTGTFCSYEPEIPTTWPVSAPGT